MKKYRKYLLLLIIFLFIGCSNENYPNGTLNVLNWSSYIPKEIINKFENEYQIKVNYLTYSSNEELLAKLTSSNKGTYDLIFPSDYMVSLMINKKMLDEIDKSKLSNYHNINPIFLKQSYDEKNTYSLPFLGATTVIAYNTDSIHNNITSYNDLLNNEYENNIVLLDDQRIMIGMGLLATNSNMNETDINKLTNAQNWLKKLNKNVKSYDSDSPKTLLITNEVDIGVIWNAEAILAKNYNNKIKIVYPKEGHAISIDNFCILKEAKNKENAYKFIDFILKDDIMKYIVEEYPYISTNIHQSNYSSDELEEIFNNGYYVSNIGAHLEKYDKVWAEIK